MGELAKGCAGSTAAPGRRTDRRTDVLVKVKNTQKQEAERRPSGSCQPSDTPLLPSGCTPHARHAGHGPRSGLHRGRWGN